jgi:antitoxin component HigA of HigAB toxin-antitoxin module
VEKRLRRLNSTRANIASWSPMLCPQLSRPNPNYPMGESSPAEMLRFLMEQRGLRQRDIVHLFGSSGVASEVINGKRAISKNQAKALAEFFRVSPELFI